MTDFFGWTPHVDVDDLRAALDVVNRGLGHHVCVCARDLYRDGAGFAFVIGATRGFQTVPQIFSRSDHFAHCIRRAQLFAQHAKGSVGDTCHGCHKHVVCQLERTNAHRGFEGVLKKEARF